MEAHSTGLCEPQGMVAVQVLVTFRQHPPQYASNFRLGRHIDRSHCRNSAERVINESNVYMPGSDDHLFFCALRGLELQLSYPNGANHLARGMRDDDDNTRSSYDICPADYELPCSMVKISTIQPLSDPMRREWLSGATSDKEQTYTVQAGD